MVERRLGVQDPQRAPQRPRTELFAEFRPWVVGQSVRITAHLTKVGDVFRPYTEGTVKLTLTVDSMPVEVTFDWKSLRSGIFGVIGRTSLDRSPNHDYDPGGCWFECSLWSQSSTSCGPSRRARLIDQPRSTARTDHLLRMRDEFLHSSSLMLGRKVGVA